MSKLSHVLFCGERAARVRSIFGIRDSVCEVVKWRRATSFTNMATEGNFGTSKLVRIYFVQFFWLTRRVDQGDLPAVDSHLRACREDRRIACPATWATSSPQVLTATITAELYLQHRHS